MNDPLIDRLERLDRDNRRLRWAVHATLAITGLVLLGAQAEPRAVPPIVEATAFHLLDADGRVRSRLGFSFNGQPQLTIMDDDGKPRVRLEVQEGGAPRLTLNDADGKARAAFQVSDDGAPSVVLSDPAGTPRARLSLALNSGPNLTLLSRGACRSPHSPCKPTTPCA